MVELDAVDRWLLGEIAGRADRGAGLGFLVVMCNALCRPPSLQGWDGTPGGWVTREMEEARITGPQIAARLERLQQAGLVAVADDFDEHGAHGRRYLRIENHDHDR